MTRSSDQERFRLDLVSVSSEVPVTCRLKRALKCLLRSFGLRCTRIEQLQPEGQPVAGNQDEQQPEG